MAKKRHHSGEGMAHEVKKEKNNTWMMATFVLGLLLVVSVFTSGFNLNNNNLDKVIKKLDAINSKESSPAARDAITKAIASLNSAKAVMDSRANDQNKGVAGDAAITIEEFSDFECPFCSRALPTINQLKAEYAGKINIVYKHFPLAQIHPNAAKAAEASECAKDQGKFWEMHDKMFENQKALGVTDLKRYAKELGMDSGKFDSCLDSGVKKSIVDKDQQEGITKGVSGTPTFFINGQKLVGAQPFESFKPVIDSILSGNAPAQPAANPQPTVPSQPQTYTGSIDNDPVKGDKNAKVVIIEWSDFQCPYCERFYSQTLPGIVSEYIDAGKVRFVYRDFPLSFHAQATPSAEASECANEQGKYWEFHDMLFENQASLGAENYKKWAADLGLDSAKFNDCVDTRKYKSEVEKDMSEGGAAGITGTPGFIVGVIQSDGKTVIGQKVSGAQPFASFKSVIDAELAKA